MTLLEHYNLASDWQRKVIIISYYHNAMKLKKKKWSVRKTASYFSKSIGLISEDLRLASHLDLVKSFRTRNEALKVLKNHG